MIRLKAVREDPRVAQGTLDSDAQRCRDRRAGDSLTALDREAIQDWMARRYLQLHTKEVGRRRTDLPMPAVVKSPGQARRLMLQTHPSWKLRRDNSDTLAS